MPTDPLTTHRVVTGVDGRPVLVKRATTDEGAARLAGEATLLRALAHPGLVPVAHTSDDELHLTWVGPHTLATVAGLPVASAGTIVGQVAAIVADLHRAGIGHGRLTADHVLLAGDGRIVLTGLADAGHLDRVPAAADVAALGALLTSLVAPHEEQMVPDRRRGRAGDGGRRAALLTLADRATADDPADRPTAADLATELMGLCAPPAGRRRRSRRAHPPAPPSPIVDLTSEPVIDLTDPPEAEPAIAPEDDTAVPTTTTVAVTSTAPRSTSTPATTAPPPPTTEPACPAVSAPAPADIDGDGCVEAVTVAGERVTVGEVTWVVGRPGDQVVVGDWDCDGAATVAALRPTTGEVFVFAGWPAGAEQVTIDAVATVADARTLRAAPPSTDGCPTLVAQMGDGSTEEVPTR